MASPRAVSDLRAYGGEGDPRRTNRPSRNRARGLLWRASRAPQNETVRERAIETDESKLGLQDWREGEIQIAWASCGKWD